MIEEDTIKLLRECDAGIKMGTASIENVMKDVSDEKFKQLLNDCKDKHAELREKIEKLLDEFRDDGKDPNIMAKGMSWMKTNVMLSVEDSDQTIADLITEGCNMGIKSLSKYLNQYEAADERSKDITKQLIGIEENLVKDIRPFL